MPLGKKKHHPIPNKHDNGRENVRAAEVAHRGSLPPLNRGKTKSETLPESVAATQHISNLVLHCINIEEQIPENIKEVPTL